MTQRAILAASAEPQLLPQPANEPRLSAVCRGAVLVHVVNPQAPRVGARYQGHCEGMTVSEAVALAGWALPWNTVLVRSDELVKRADWDVAVIGRDELVVLITQPLGGNGGTSQILATVAMIALSLAAPQIGVALLGETLAGTAAVAGVTFGQLATVGIVLAGSTLISALLPHPAPFAQTSATQSPTYSLNGQSNLARLLQVKPERGGLFRFLPDLASQAYFDFTGTQQDLYEEFDLGMGAFDIEEMGVANNPIFKKSLITEENPGGYTGTYPEIELQICPPGTPQTLFPNNVVTSTDVSNITLVGTEDPDHDWSGPYVTNPADTQTSRVAFDISLPAGLFKLDSGGKLQNATVSFEIQAQPIDDAGNASGDRVSILAQSLTMASRDAVRTTFDVAMTPGRYRVWFERTNAKSADPNVSDILVMLAMRAFMPGQNVRANTTVVALKARSTKNLNGSSAQQFYVIATRKLPLYVQDEGTGAWSWTEPQATRSIAAMASYICRSQNGLRKPDSKIDLEYLWGVLHPIWEERGDHFDGTFDTRGSAWDALQTVLRCGRAQPLKVGRRIAFTRDQPKTIPRAPYSPLNMTPGSFNIDYLHWDATALDALWIDYIDARNWQPMSVFCALPDSTVDPNDAPHVQMLGIIERDHAWREGMFMVAGNRYRRAFPNFGTELDGRVCLRGDLIAVSHWVIGHHQAASVIALSRQDGGDILTFDQPWEPKAPVGDEDPLLVSIFTPDGRAYGPVTFDLVDDGSYTGQMQARLTQTANLTVGRYAGQHPRDWPQFSISGAPNMDWPRATYGSGTLDDLMALVVSMRPNGRDAAAIAAVLDDPRVHTADAGDPPEETNAPGTAVVDDLTIGNILIGEVAADTGGTQLNITVVGAPDAVSFDYSLSWDEAPDVVDLVGQPRDIAEPSQAGTLVISARAVGASGIGPWFTIGTPFEAAGVPLNAAPDYEEPLTGALAEVTL